MLKRLTTLWTRFPIKQLQTKRFRLTSCAIQLQLSLLIAFTWSCSKFARQKSSIKQWPDVHSWKATRFSAMIGKFTMSMWLEFYFENIGSSFSLDFAQTFRWSFIIRILFVSGFWNKISWNVMIDNQQNHKPLTMERKTLNSIMNWFIYVKGWTDIFTTN